MDAKTGEKKQLFQEHTETNTEHTELCINLNFTLF